MSDEAIKRFIDSVPAEAIAEYAIEVIGIQIANRVQLRHQHNIDAMVAKALQERLHEIVLEAVRVKEPELQALAGRIADIRLAKKVAGVMYQELMAGLITEEVLKRE